MNLTKKYIANNTMQIYNNRYVSDYITSYIKYAT